MCDAEDSHMCLSQKNLGRAYVAYCTVDRAFLSRANLAQDGQYLAGFRGHNHVETGMNWMQRIAQQFPPSYTGVGHGYRWNEQEGKLEELWRTKNHQSVILWSYEGGQIIESVQAGNDPHWSDTDDARGRIELESGLGSITFALGKEVNTRLQMRILDALTDKYPGVRFAVYARGGPYSLQEYWQMLESGDA